jgi:hypothetical protein
METTPFIEAVDHFLRVETSHLIKCRSPSFVVNLLLQWHIKICFHGVSDDAINKSWTGQTRRNDLFRGFYFLGT